MKGYFYSIILVLLTLFSINASASHYWGGEITYEKTGTNMYDIYLTIISDCQASPVNLPLSLNVDLVSSCTTFTFQLNQISAVDNTPVCPGVTVTNCTNPAVSNIPVTTKLNTYKAQLDLTGLTCTEFELSYSNCCRYPTTTSTQAGNSLLEYHTILNNISGQNSAPQFTDYTAFGFEQQEVTLNFGGFDPDGDSLYYELIDALNYTYASSFSGINPFSVNGSIDFNSQTGLMKFTPSTFQTSVVAVKIQEFRGGVKIGEIIRERLVIIIPNNNNIYPAITGIDSTSNDLIVVDVDSLVEFDIYSTNYSTPDVELILESSLPGATLVNTGLDRWTFTWQPDTTFVRSYPHHITVKAQNVVCTLRGITFKNYFIKVEDPNNNAPVWPGDANNDLVANNLDLLTIGQTYGNSGPVRPGATINWTGQTAPLWPQNLPNLLNLKFSDTNGDGVINANDTLAIVQNYGLTHNKTGATGGTATADPVLYIEMPDSIEVGETVNAPIFLGTAALPADSVYGIAFSVLYDYNLVEPNTAIVTFNPNWMGAANSTISISKDFHSNGVVDAAVTRINQTNISGFGQIGTLSYVVPDDIAGKRTVLAKTMTITLGNIHAISSNGAVITFSGSADSVVVYDKASAVELKLKDAIKIYPNPAVDEVTIDAGNIIVESIIVTDITGKMITQITSEITGKYKIDLTHIEKGIYFINIKTSEGTSSYKLVKS